jgi:hypothetical protein
VNQTYIINSSFCCRDCGEQRKYEKGNKALELEISFRLPGYLTRPPESRNWNFNRKDFHRKLKVIARQFADRGIDDLIDTGLIGTKRVRIDRYAAQRIVSTWEEWEKMRKPEKKSRRPKNPRQMDLALSG